MLIFSGLDAKLRRESAAGENLCPIGGAMRNLRRQLAPILCQSLARWFERNFGPNFNPRNLSQNLRSVPLEVVGCFSDILLHRFLQKRTSIEISASSFLRFSENYFCRKPNRFGILRHVVAEVLRVSLLATKISFLCRSFVSAITLRSHENTG